MWWCREKFVPIVGNVLFSKRQPEESAVNVAWSCKNHPDDLDGGKNAAAAVGIRLARITDAQIAVQSIFRLKATAEITEVIKKEK